MGSISLWLVSMYSTKCWRIRVDRRTIKRNVCTILISQNKAGKSNAQNSHILGHPCSAISTTYRCEFSRFIWRKDSQLSLAWFEQNYSNLYYITSCNCCCFYDLIDEIIWKKDFTSIWRYYAYHSLIYDVYWVRIITPYLKSSS